MQTPDPTEDRAPTGDDASVPRPVAGPASFDVFLSYRSSDHVVVERLASELAARGVRPFLDRWDLEPGKRWRPELEEVLARCGSVAVLIGPQGMGDVQKREVDVALRRQDREPGFRVVPVLLPGGEPPSGFLEALTWVDLRHVDEASGVADLQRALGGDWNAAASKARSEAARAVYRINFVLLLVTLLLGAAWYYRHLHSRWEEWLVGGALTGAALLWIVIGYFRWGAGKEVEDLTRRLLAGLRTRRLLVGALAIGIAMNYGTASMHLQLDAGAAGGGRVEVEVLDAAGRAVWVPKALEAGHPRATRLFVTLIPREVEVRLKAEDGRGPLRLPLAPGSRREVRVPSQVPLRSVSLLRILPDPGLVFQLGRPGQEVNRRFSLRITDGRGATSLVEDVRGQALYLGASESDVTLGRGREPLQERRERYGRWVGEHTALPDVRQRDELVRCWEESARAVAAAGLAYRETLQFTLIPEGDQEGFPLRATVLDPDAAIRTLMLERQP